VENGNLAGGNSTSLAFAFRRDTGSSWAPRLRAAEEWLLIEWPRAEAEPTKYWLSTLPANTKLQDLVRLAKQRWIIERDYQELKQELGLGHYEGRGWRGFSPPRYPLYRGLWFPGGRTEPFFPLGSRRSSALIRSPSTAALPPSGLAPCAPSGITPGPLQLCTR
jgi:hypothetical protein